jgi:EmrB/QacA subfamily drug resistance transporter
MQKPDAVTTFMTPDGSAPTRPGWWPLVIIASAHLMAVLDITVMFVALPSAQHALGLSEAARQWVVTAYTLAFAGLLLPGGRLADRLGARRTLLLGVTGFACASAVGGASADGAMLIAARAAQGAFGAVLVSSTKSLLITVYSGGRERSRAMGIFTAVLTAGLAAGMVLGGVITSVLGWRWCLYVNVAVALVIIIAARRVLPAGPGRAGVRPGVRIDVLGAVLACAAMVALVYGLGEVPSDRWASGQIISSLIAAAVLFAWFTARQVRGPHPLLPVRVVGDRNRGGGLIAMVSNSVSTFGMLFILTYQLQTVMGYSPLRTGLALIPFAAAAASGSAVIAPRLTLRIRPRWLVATGLLLSAVGLLPLVALTSTSKYLPLILVAEVIEGLGTGLGGPPILQACLRAVLPADTGAASAASSAAGQLGSSIGAAVLNTIAATTAAAYLAAHATASTAATNTAATVHGYTVAAAWGAAILLATTVPAVLLINAKPPSHSSK